LHQILAHSKVSQNRDRDSSLLAPIVAIGVYHSCIGREREGFLDDLISRTADEIVTFINESLFDDLVVGHLNEGNGREHGVHPILLLPDLGEGLVLGFEVELQKIADKRQWQRALGVLGSVLVVADDRVDQERDTPKKKDGE
ncbi:hypothetical protein PENTCL1PPCAC_15149, partial [Pristionchus entomophagus]